MKRKLIALMTLLTLLCGATMTACHTKPENVAWKYNDDEHWKNCANCEINPTCSVKIASGVHTFEEGSIECICGYQRYTKGLEYTSCIYNNKECYFISGIGKATDTEIVTPKTFKKKYLTENDKKDVVGIGKKAFANCENITRAFIRSSITSVGISAFEGCKGLTSVEFEAESSKSFEKLPVILDNAFKDCAVLEEINLDGISAIGQGAFEGCNKLIETVGGVQYVGNWAIGYTNSVQSTLALRAGTVGIADYAFEGCESLKEVIIPNSVKAIGQGVFLNCKNISRLELGSNVKTIGRYAFEDCRSLETVTIPSSVTEIGAGAFRHCRTLENISVQSKNTSYKEVNGSLYTKDGKKLLQYALAKRNTEYTIPIGVEVIEDSAISYADNLTKIEIPSSVKTITSGALSWCDDLTEIKVTGGNYYKVAGGVLYTKDGKTLVQYPIGKEKLNKSPLNFKIPAEVTSIAVNAFAGCKNLDERIAYVDGWLVGVDSETYSINIQSGTKGIADYALAECSGIRNITIPSSMRYIGEGAFVNCTNLSALQFAQGGEALSIGKSAFMNCTALNKVEIPESVTKISESIFQGCTKLETFAYTENVTEIDAFAFKECESLKRIYIFETVKMIEQNAFQSCSELAIFCKVELKPDNWDINWNCSSCPVRWGVLTNDNIEEE